MNFSLSLDSVLLAFGLDLDWASTHLRHVLDSISANPGVELFWDLTGGS